MEFLMPRIANPAVLPAKTALRRQGSYYRAETLATVIGWVVGVIWLATGSTIFGFMVAEDPDSGLPAIPLCVALFLCAPVGFGVFWLTAWLVAQWDSYRVGVHERRGDIMTVSSDIEQIWRDALRQVNVPMDSELASLEANFARFASPMIRQYDQHLADEDVLDEDKKALRARLSGHFTDVAENIKTQLKVIDGQAKLIKHMRTSVQHDAVRALLSQPLH
jgi:hypothetical protein